MTTDDLDENDILSNDFTELITYLDNAFDVNVYSNDLLNDDIISVTNSIYPDIIPLDLINCSNNYTNKLINKSNDSSIEYSDCTLVITNQTISNNECDDLSSDFDVNTNDSDDDLIDKLKNMKRMKRSNSNNSLLVHKVLSAVTPNQFPSLMCSMFNAGDLNKLTSLINSLFHPTAFIDSSKPSVYPGYKSTQEFIDRLRKGYRVFPSSTMLLKKFKSAKQISSNDNEVSSNDRYSYLTFKIRFSGLSSFHLLSSMGYEKTSTITVLMDKKTHSEDEINQLKELEQSLNDSGDMTLFFLKASYRLCLDHSTNLITHGMLDLKLSSFKPFQNNDYH